MEILRTCAILVIVSFTVHFGWEYLHFGLYTGYERWTGGVPVYVLASIGDVLYTLGAFALVSAVKKTYSWIAGASLTDYLTLVSIGFLIALFVEYKGIALDRWTYLPEMPILPIFGVGLSPILQMSLLLPLSVFLTQWMTNRFRSSE